MDSKQFLMLVSLTADRYGCKIVAVDMLTKYVSIYGPSDQAMIDCAEALERLFHRFTQLPV